ncbi:MAG: Coenzyme F420 hydrogenase/dehydrogenase, beta subunit C-terminal domain [Acidiferrobacterales bacterium]|nr:Coenzyme F420 hydrogenase/dehydrogenase, beta subunit C-terminal domain [Acidiferrobacterales bacterium]
MGAFTVRKKPSYVRGLLRDLSPNKQLERIVDDGMCIGCGICESVAGADQVTMQIAEDGSLVPHAKTTIDDTLIDQILGLCPGTKVEGLPERLVQPDSQYDEVWGIWRQMHLAYAGDEQTRFRSSTGGLLTALAQFLIDSGEVNFILHAREDETIPAFGQNTVSRSKEEVASAAGSRYGPTPTLKNIVGVLDQCEATGETFAFIGTPCDISGLRNLAQQDARVDQYCVYQLAMVCGGFMKPSGLSNVMNEHGVNADEITSLRYRGYGCPGPTRIETRSAEIIELDYLDFWGEDDSGWDLPHRCKICPDGIGDATDIAAADSWDGGAPDRQGQHSDPGSNSVIVRTLAGERLLAAAVKAGFIQIESSITPRDMDRFQPHQVKKKQAVWSRFVGMRAANSVVPDVRGLRLKPLARRNSIAENLAQARGAKKRAKQLLRD